MMLSFMFNGKDSFQDFGIYVEKRPNIPSPKRRVTYIEVPGRDSMLRRDEETYEDITLSVECSLIGDPYSKISGIKSWLLNAGESDLIFSYQPERKYIAQVVNSIDFEVVLKITSHFVILFNCQPFQYATVNVPVSITDGSVYSLYNPGTVKSLPIIKVNGSGSGSLTVNGKSVHLTNIDESVILNSDLQETYKDTGTELLNKNTTKTGKYPLLLPGENTISFSGGITSLEITPNWRWL
jgi:predicted phage tail component-like protein